MRKPFGPEGRIPNEGHLPLEERVAALCKRSPIFAVAIDRAMSELSENPQDSIADAVTTPEARKQDWYARRTLFVTGPHASGKSAVVRAALKKEEGFAVFDTGPILRGYHRSDSPHLTFGAWAVENETRYGDNFTDELLAYHMRTAVSSGVVEHPSGIVVIGNRSYGGVAYLADRLNPSDSKIVYVDARREALYERYKSREGKHDITLSDFDAVLDADIRMGLPELAERADHFMLNDDELPFVAQQLRDYVESWVPPIS